jgi:hypothetical protein
MATGATTTQPYASRSMRRYPRMPRTIGDVRLTAWTVLTLYFEAEDSLYDRYKSASPKTAMATGATTTQPYASRSMRCYPRMPRTMCDVRLTAWTVLTLYFEAEDSLQVYDRYVAA